MSFQRFLCDNAEYRRFIGDGQESGYVAEYESYTLSGVMVREHRAIDQENLSVGTATLYFFPQISSCTDAEGNVTGLPEYRGGDLCVIHSGGGGERVLRVAEAGYYDDAADGLCHVRLKLI